MNKEDIYTVVLFVVAMFALGYLLFDPSLATKEAMREFAFLPRF